MKPEVKNWLEQAKRDLQSAKHNLESKDFNVASFLSQQAAEKALKALQLKKEGKITKTHDLPFLAGKLKLPKNIVENCDRISHVYIETRYPDASGEFADYSKKESKEDVNLAEEIVKWVGKNL